MLCQAKFLFSPGLRYGADSGDKGDLMFRRHPLPILIAVIALTISVAAQQAPLQKVAINYPTRSAGSWPMFIAKEGGN